MNTHTVAEGMVDNSTTALVTADELTALRLLRKIMEKQDVTWGYG